MSWNRYARKTDDSALSIMDALRRVGYVVVVIGRPVDVAVTHRSWPLNLWRMGELKTPKGKSQKLKLRADQQEQQEFCAENGVPYWTTPQMAIEWLQEHRP